MNQTILIITDCFSPAFKAGGPVQSLNNLVDYFENKLNFKVICSNKDINDEILKVKHNCWIKFNDSTFVWYSRSKSFLSWIPFLKENNSNLIYVNGIYSLKYNLLPIIFKKKSNVIIAPRGMLQTGALSSKKMKKHFYLYIIKLFGLFNNVRWHATDNQEKQDIEKWFPKNDGVYNVPNIPKKPFAEILNPNKIENKLKLVYFSLISEKKNLHLLLEVVKNIENITLDIYGPIKDKKYWAEKCLPLLKNSSLINYKKEIEPHHVQNTLEEYDCLILLTKGENFGHAIYESLSVGRPVIISEFTPWKNLKDNKAGINVNINSVNDILNGIVYFKNMDSETFFEYCNGAHSAAKKYYFDSNFEDGYKKLFTF